ncbi:MAG: PFL family protein [Ktedonobacteraceae bacterium]
MSLFTAPIRTITLGIAEAHPLSAAVIAQAATRLQRALTRYTEAGYEVQTLRLSTRPLFNDLVDWSPAALLSYAQDLQQMLDAVSISFCSLGPAQLAQPHFPLERLELLADLLASTSALNATVQLASTAQSLRADAAIPTARIIQRLAQETDEGFGNFRFAMLACLEPGSPFFPAAYHSGPASLALGLQGAGVVAQAMHEFLTGKKNTDAMPVDLLQVSDVVKTAMVEYARPIVILAQKFAAEERILFGGIDLSPAPLGEDSIVAAMELCGYGTVGTPGTLAVAAALTAGLKDTELPTCGYCGLMLPVLEDAVLGQRWEEGYVNVHQLLLYSAVCGTGLDTLPLPGNIATEEIARLLLDVATLALRLQKPLSARLFPVPGKDVGNRTTFTSPYLTNTLVK